MFRLFRVMLLASLILCLAGPASAGLVTQPLPVLRSQSLGPGSNPSLGNDGFGTALHYRSNSTGWRVWTPSANPGGTDVASPLADGTENGAQVASSRCKWGGSVLFCAGTLDFELPPYVVMHDDKVFAYDWVSETRASVTYVRDSLGAGMRDSFNGRAVIEKATGELRLVEWNGTTLQDALIWGGSGSVNGHPVIGNSYVAYQRPVSGDWVLDVWSTVDHALVASSPTFGAPPNPSNVSGYLVAYELQESVLETFVRTGIWDPQGTLLNPKDYGCSQFRQMKYARRDLTLVQGVGCLEGDSVLYALTSEPYGIQPFFVGTLSANNPDFTARDDQIAFVDANGIVRWVRADLEAIGGRINEPESERDPPDDIELPNDSREEAIPLQPWQIAYGSLANASGVDPGDWWVVDLEDGWYKIATSVYGPGTYCDYVPPEDTKVTLCAPDDSDLEDCDSNDANAIEIDGFDAFANYCGVVFAELTAGQYYILVEDGPDWPGATDSYSLVVVPCPDGEINNCPM